jgi:hypothetical protein
MFWRTANLTGDVSLFFKTYNSISLIAMGCSTDGQPRALRRAAKVSFTTVLTQTRSSKEKALLLTLLWKYPTLV